MSKDQEIIKKIKSSMDNRIKFGICDIDGVFRGKIIHKEKFIDSLDDDIGFCDVIFGWDVEDELYDNTKITGWHTGYPDAKANLDISTYRTIPWEEGIPFFIGDFSKSKHPACSRTLLKTIVQKADKLGFRTKFSQEFEWFNFKEDPDSLNDKDFRRPITLSPGMFGYSVIRISQNNEYINDLFTLLEEFGVPVEGLHTETGPGVYEAAIRYTDILEAADRAALFKTSVKEIASKYGLIASFMAKWNQELPGCSGHIHQSLWKDDENLFYDKNADYNISPVMESYIAGQLKCLPEIMPFYAPTINSYKRLVEGTWAPTTVSWGIDNRTTALRAIAAGTSGTRLETRIPGSDTNPYLAMAASLASGLYGIENNLKLDIKPTTGSAYQSKSAKALPKNLEEATEKMRASKIAQSLFGEEFLAHFTQTREWEIRQYAKAVTDWELKRYFEII